MARELRWTDHELVVEPGSPLLARSHEGVAAGPEVVRIQLPDLTDWAQPLEKARILLESAAEIEHALMVQYLYAAYSLETDEQVTDPARQAALDWSSPDSWPQTLLSIAREEMGHLLTVQHLLLVLGLPPNLEREDFPPRKSLYPFPLHLEGLSQRSLAKYVVAEAPAGAAGIDDIAEMAQAAAGAMINRVGLIYGLLGVVFATAEQVAAGASGDAEWDALLRQLAEAAYEQAPAAAWHLEDGAFHPQAADAQALPEDWEVGDLRVHRILDRASALEAIRDVGEQGEGATGDATGSHFARLLRIYRGGDGMAAFPAPGEWAATRDVPTDPQPEADITEPRAKLRARLADLRYALLLGLIEHYLLSTGDDRGLLAVWTFAEMRSRVAVLARQLTAMPRAADGSSGVAAMPFTLPAELHLPGAEADRWALHAARMEASVALVEEMQGADAADAGDRYLADLLRSDRARLAFVSARAAGASASPGFVRDILPLFRPKDAEHMAALRLDLREHEPTARKAAAILTRVRSAGPRRMPPPPDQPWTEVQSTIFERWIADGCPE